jgi:hypothetical protein
MAALDDLDQVLTPFREYDLFVVSVEPSGVDATLAHAERARSWQNQSVQITIPRSVP